MSTKKLCHTDWNNIAIGRTESGTFVQLREAPEIKGNFRFYVCVGASPIQTHYTSLLKARNLFAVQFNIN